MKINDNSYMNGRFVEWFHHESGKEYGYKKTQTDSFAVLHPKDEEKGKEYPLYVVFHSAGHDLYSTLGCTPYVGNHDIYHAPENMYALYLDCRFNQNNDWWWGGVDALGKETDPSHGGIELQPVEKRCIDTVEYVLNEYPIDRNAVFAVGNSMGGSGALGIAFPRGDIFTAILANVPAGVEHICDRSCLGREKPDGFSIPDPPLVVDYSAQNDEWSTGHEKLYQGMAKEKYALVGYFGIFGHANSLEFIRTYNDLVLTFDALSMRKNEAYPAFTNASTDDPIPWPDHRDSELSGQVNAFFRFKNREDTASVFSIDLWLAGEDEIKTANHLPQKSVADVTLRRIQNFAVRPGERIHYIFGEKDGTVSADETGHITIPAIPVCREKTALILGRG